MNTRLANVPALRSPLPESGEPQNETDGLDITSVLVFGVTAIGLGGFSLISLLSLMGFA